MTPAEAEAAAMLKEVHLTAADLRQLAGQSGGDKMDEGERTNIVEGMADTGTADVVNKNRDVAKAAKILDMNTADLEDLLTDNGFMSVYEVNQGQAIRHAAEHARNSVDESIEILKQIMRDPDTPADVKVAAARALIEGAVQLDAVRLESEAAAVSRHRKASQAQATGHPGRYGVRD